MKIRKSGIYKQIDAKDFGIYQSTGWEKVINEPLPKLEEVKPKKVEEIIIEEEQPIKEVEPEPIEEEVVIPKSKKRK